MKKTAYSSVRYFWLVALLLVACGKLATAQEDTRPSEVPTSAPSKPGFKLGPVLGLNSANISVVPATSTSARTGVSAGLIAEGPLGGNFYFEPGLMYAQYGYTVSISGSSATEEFDVIDIPLIVKMKIGDPSARFIPAILAGPSLAFRVSDSIVTSSSTTDNTANSESFGLSFILGLGAEYAVTPDISLTLSTRYHLGINNLSKTAGQNVKQRTLQFLLGVLFSL